MRLLFFLVLIFAPMLAPAQSCYVRLEDASGFNTDAYQADLEAAACALRAAFPDTFQNKFKVYDFGFYLHQETYSGGYPEAFAQKIAQVNANPAVPYYLLFGKQTDASGVYTRFWVEVKLPTVTPFNCVDELTLNTIKEQILLTLGQKYQSYGSIPNNYKESEIAGMQKLRDIVFKYKDCCLCCGKKQTNCESCEYIDESYAQCIYGDATLRAKIENFVAEHGCTEKVKDFANEVSKLICEDRNFKWERFEELYNLLETNPNALLGTCAGGPPIHEWENLASFVVSGLPLQRIQNSGTWDVQRILDASGSRVNLDYFAVVIDELPIINGQRLTSKQLLDYFRKNINTFTAPSIFTPYDKPYDEDLWFSENPLGAVLHIGIDRVTDGDVLTAQYEDCCWIFTTLKGPSYYAGYHPVSGNRMFGYKIQDGKTVIFTRGTDRTTTWLHSLKGSEIAFEGADQLWRSVQHNLVEYVKSNGGKLGPVPTQEIIHRPNWSEVKKALTSNYPVTKIPCN